MGAHLDAAKTYNLLNASDEEVKRSAKQIFNKLVVGKDTAIGRVNGKLVLTRHSPKPY